MIASESLSNCNAATMRGVDRRKRAAVELAVGVATALLMLWTDHRSVLDKSERTALHAAAGAIFLGLLIAQRPSSFECGLRPTSWTAGVGVLAGCTAAGTFLMAAFASKWPAQHGDPNFDLSRWIIRNGHVDVLQQIVLQIFLWPRLALLMGDSFTVHGTLAKASFATAFIFGALHAPNVPLMAATTAAGFGWVEWFRRFRNLPAVIISHVALATAAIAFVGFSDLRVGIGYVMRR